MLKSILIVLSSDILWYTVSSVPHQVVLADDLQSLVDKASEKFGDTVVHLETIHGGIIDDFMLIQ